MPVTLICEPRVFAVTLPLGVPGRRLPNVTSTQAGRALEGFPHLGVCPCTRARGINGSHDELALESASGPSRLNISVANQIPGSQRAYRGRCAVTCGAGRMPGLRHRLVRVR